MKKTECLMSATASMSPWDKGQHEILRDSQLLTKLSFQRVFEDVASVSGAGFETTGSVLRLLSFHVFSSPKLFKRLRRQLGSAGMSLSNAMKLKIQEQLPYLTATIMEGLRLSPGVAIRMACIAPDPGIFYESWRIPAGTPVGMTTILMRTVENFCPNPHSFEPER